MKNFANRTIVVPFDFSGPAAEAVDEALEWAEDSTTIHVIHIVNPTPVIISMDPALPVPPSYDEGRYEHALKELREKFGKGEYARIKVHCEIGDPGSEIVKFANHVKANMIIMPSHGRTGLSRMFLGSVAERVLRLSSCPVLVLRKPKT